MSIVDRLDEFTSRQGIVSAEWCKLLDGVEKLQEQNKILREALEFYADENNWELGKFHSFVEVCEQDHEWTDSLPPFRVTQLTGGKRAREALAKVKE